MNKLFEELSVFEAMPVTTVANGADEDGERFSLGKFRRALIFVEAVAEDRDAWIDDAELHVVLNEATALTGGLTNDLKVAELVGGVNVLEAELWLQNAANDDTVTINGVTFTRTAAGYHATDRPFQWETPTELRTAINAAGLGITAGAPADTHGVGLTVDDPGNMTMTIDVDIANPTGQLATLKACAAVEVFVSEMATGYGYLFINVDNDHGLAGDVDVYGVAVKGAPMYAPCHNVWAAKAV